MRILAYRGLSVVSKAIRFQTRSPYSHVAMELDDGTVVEAWHKGGVSHSSSFRALHTHRTPVDVFAIRPPFDKEAAERFLLSQVGKGYDFASVFRFLTRRKAPANDKWFCSELVEAAMIEGQLRLLNGSPSEHSPRDTVMSPLLEKVDELIC